MGIDPFSLVMFAASTAYQLSEANKMKAKMKAAEEARKGFEITVSGAAAPLPVCYGKNILGGVEVKHMITSGYAAATLGSSTHFVENFDNTTVGGNKNKYLHVQYALCHEGIAGVQGIHVNDLAYDDPEQRFSHSIRTYSDGGTADAISTANGAPSTNTFTGVAYAAATFRLDRDDPQYNGAPLLGFMVKGRKVRSVELNAGVYSLSTSFVYSNNSALCLLDFLLDGNFGRGLSVDEVDLKSFYDSALICGATVSSGRSVAGVVNGGAGTRDIPLYECNITLDTNKTIRENIRSIMDTMALAELVWSSEGKYKLLVEYPTSQAETDALVHASHYFTDDDIVRDDITLSWPSASDRFNQVTVSFMNEHEDFKSDSMTWPTSYSAAHTAYLAEDNQQPFAGSMRLDGITDPYHALARAEQMVRQSRGTRTLSLRVTKKGLSLEPGDFININSVNTGILDEVFRVQSIEVNSDFSVALVCYSFDHNNLAWNVNDDIAYAVRPTYDFSVEPVTSLVYTAGRPAGDHTAIAELNWSSPTDNSFKAVVYYTDAAGDLVILGETSSNSFYLYPRGDWSDGESVTFTVKAQTPFGRLSEAATVTNTVVSSPPAPTSFSASEALYQTNAASGVKARATLSFSEPVGGVEPKDFRVEYYRDEDGSTYELLGHTVGETLVFNDVRAGNYHFKITPTSWFGVEGVPLIGTKEILGLSAIPSDPTGLEGSVTDTGILLTWDEPADLDVRAGGHTQVRYVRDDTISPTWATAQVIVERIGGLTTTATLPVASGYYLIKHFDSSGNPSAGFQQFLNTYAGPGFNIVETLSEDPSFSGVKTNCTVVGSNLELDAGVTSMSYTFANSIDLGSVESVRLIPNLKATITDGATTVADYDLISAVARFSGPIVDGAVNFEVRYTDDDPSGTPTWSAWEAFTVGNYRHRGFEFRLTAVVGATSYTISVSELSLTADKEDTTKRGSSTSSTGGDTTVTFSTPFYSGVSGTEVPYVGVNTVGGSSGDTVNIVSTSATSFVYSVYNSGARVARTVNWAAVGP